MWYSALSSCDDLIPVVIWRLQAREQGGLDFYFWPVTHLRIKQGLRNGGIRRWTFLPQDDDDESEDSSDDGDTEEENDSEDEKNEEVDEDFRSQLINVLQAGNALVCFEYLPWYRYQEVWGGEKLLKPHILSEPMWW